MVSESSHKGPLLGAQRRQQILDHLANHGAVKVTALSHALGFSPATLRRDLAHLDRAGLVRRTHGGALLPSGGPAEVEPRPREKAALCAAEKRAIGRAAAQLVKPGDVIALNGGTTTTQVARALRTLASLRVVTNSVSVAVELADLPGIEVTLTGGTLRGSLELFGPIVEQVLQGLYAQVAFLGVDGLTLRHGLTTYNPLEAHANRLILSRAERVVVVADHTKIGRVTTALIAPCSEMHVLITDDKAPPEELEMFRRAGITVIVAP
ncbi:MAG TPA: DeoR/GlpR family DNA-binding transcription regulator [Chloroflexota bacterium]|nr:DeoR/GlpR family DNA-binding transcription regulator [Chloroflexota bacterium]HZS91396.1 DeoR/GlpR family DNA-binding transcription regulator [Chloroflexota bacterium]